MASKEQTHSNNKARSQQQQPPKPAAENSGMIAQKQTDTATIIQQTRLDPRLLSPRAILQLQRTLGNRAVRSVLTQTMPHQVLQKEGEKIGSSDFSTLIVEDAVTDLAPGQMKKSDFLKQLYQALYKVGMEEYQGTDLTVEGCPYIVYWFDRYREEDSSHIERALRKYVSAPPIGSTEELIHLIAERARQGFREQVSTGAITELPEDVPEQLGDDVVPEPDTIVQREIKGIQRTPAQQSLSNVKTNVVQRGTKKGKGKPKKNKPLLVEERQSDSTGKGVEYFERRRSTSEASTELDLEFEELKARLRQGSAEAVVRDPEARTDFTSEEAHRQGFALLPMLLKYVEHDRLTPSIKQFKGEERAKRVYKLQKGLLIKADDATPLNTTGRDLSSDMKVMNVLLQSGIPEDELFVMGEVEMREKAEEIGGNYIFIMNASGDIFAGEEEAKIVHHSSFLAGGAVAAAGYIKVRNGVIEMVNNMSGHYHPGPAYLWQALVNMGKNGVDLSNVHVEVRGIKGKFKNAVHFVQAFDPSAKPKFFDTEYALQYLNEYLGD